MSSKPVGGFDLVLGHAYNDGWFNEASPLHQGPACHKCMSPVTIFRLEKVILAFGKLITKHCTIIACPDCLHEELVEYREPNPVKATKKNFAKIFSKLPKEVQAKLLGGNS